MSYFLLDASALAKRYHTEAGSSHVDDLFHRLLTNGADRLIVPVLTIAETYAVIHRRANDQNVPASVRTAMAGKLITEVKRLSQLGISKRAVIRSIPLIGEHQINSADAILLGQALRLKRFFDEQRQTLILVTSDKRLLRAASSVELRTLDPETCSARDVETLVQQR